MGRWRMKKYFHEARYAARSNESLREKVSMKIDFQSLPRNSPIF